MTFITGLAKPNVISGPPEFMVSAAVSSLSEYKMMFTLKVVTKEQEADGRLWLQPLMDPLEPLWTSRPHLFQVFSIFWCR